MAVTVELVLLSRVSYGSLEITGSRLQGLLALLAENPRQQDQLNGHRHQISRSPARRG